MFSKIKKMLFPKKGESKDDSKETEKVLSKEITDFLHEQGYSMLRVVPGRGICGLKRFLFTTGLCYGLDGHGYKGRYCYATHMEAFRSLVTWDGQGDPGEKWIKHKGGDGERSNTNSDQCMEDSELV